MMKINLLSWGIIASSIITFGSGIALYISGSKKSDEIRKKPAIVITKAHPLPSKFRADTTGVELRSGPGDYFPVVGRLTKKDDYQIIDSDGEWYRIAPIRNPASAAWARLNPSLR